MTEPITREEFDKHCELLWGSGGPPRMKEGQSALWNHEERIVLLEQLAKIAAFLVSPFGRVALGGAALALILSGLAALQQLKPLLP